MRATFLAVVAVFLILGWNAAPVRSADKPGTSHNTKLGGKTFDEWKKDLTDHDPAVVENAIRTIMLYGPNLAGEVVPILVKKLDKSNLDISVKVSIAIFLGYVTSEDNHADLDKGITGLIRMLRSDQVIVKLHAALALARLGKDARDAIPELRRTLFHYSWEIRKASALALASVAQPRSKNFWADSLVVDRLRDRVLKDPCFQVRLEAARALVVIGPPKLEMEKKRVERDLVLATHPNREKHKTVRIWAHVGVMRMSKVDDKHLNAIAKMLDDPVLLVKCEAARVLGMIGPQAKSQVGNLISALDDKEPLMVKTVIEALVEIGTPAMRSVRKLEALAKASKDEGLKATIKAAVHSIKTARERRDD